MAKVQINLRTEADLKEKLLRIAEQEKTSLNDVAVRGIEEFVAHYDLERVADDAIPSRAQVEAALGGIKAEILARCRNKVKHALNSMVQSARNHTFMALFENEDGLPSNIKKEISHEISQELEKLGYFIFTFSSEYMSKDSPIYFYDSDIAIALNQEDLKYYERIEKDFGGEIPF